MIGIVKHRKKKPEKFFLLSIMLFGVLSIFLTFPLTNGDEGYHLSRSYTIFSKKMPQSMQTETIRRIEMITTSPDPQNNGFSFDEFFKTKLSDVEDDSVKINFQKESNITAKIDLGHLPSALGVVIGRYIYPSYGIMMIFARAANLIFFATCFFFIIKLSSVGKWSLVMMFSIPFLQKMASPSYDVFAYVSVAAFSINLLKLAKLKHFKQLSLRDILTSIVAIILILFSKSNYVFILPMILFLPMIKYPVIQIYFKQNKFVRLIFWLIIALLTVILIILLNNKFGLINFSKQFFNSYLNTATMGRRGESLFNVVSTFLPDFLNIFWLLCLFFVMLTEEGYKWDNVFIIGSLLIFLLNWIGIFAAFYISLGRPTHAFDELSGRYLHPFIICFLPFSQSINYKYRLTTSEKAVERVAIASTLIIMIVYLLICYYRGFIIHVTPTWKS